MTEKKKYREVIAYKDYFNDFYSKQTLKVKKKVIWTLQVIEEIERIPKTYLKHLEGTDGLYEIRIKFTSNIYRIFCFFDKGKLVVLANGFRKKSQKTPKKEVVKALAIKKEYEKEK